MIKPFFRWLGKALLGGCLAFLLLGVFCFFYYNIPIHYANPTGATEYRWQEGHVYNCFTEGFSLGRVNNDGFNNIYDYTSGERIDILLMGSSHMEGFNVPRNRNTAAVLNTLFDGEKYVYNIGTAGHTLPYCVKHLGAALDSYAPGQYVLLETVTLDLSPSDMDAAVNRTLPDIPSYTGGFVGLLQRIPLLRLFYTKYIKNAFAFGDTDDAPPDPAPENTGTYALSLSAFLEKIGRESAERGIQAVIVFNPAVGISPEGSLYTKTETEQLKLFRQFCDENDIRFVDLTDTYMRAYREQYLLPSGFSNTAPARGHLNAVGHRLIAEALYTAITAWEG